MSLSDARSSERPIATTPAHRGGVALAGGASPTSFLPVSPLPQGGLPDHQRRRQPWPGASPGDHGVPRWRRPLERQFGAHRPASTRDDLHQLARLDQRHLGSSTSAATSTPPAATSRRRSTRRAASLPAKPAEPIPNYRKSNPADAPDHPDGAPPPTWWTAPTIYDLASSILQQKLAQVLRRRPRVIVGRRPSLPAVRV